jgi:hypothetical protein
MGDRDEMWRELERRGAVYARLLFSVQEGLARVDAVILYDSYAPPWHHELGEVEPDSELGVALWVTGGGRDIEQSDVVSGDGEMGFRVAERAANMAWNDLLPPLRRGQVSTVLVALTGGEGVAVRRPLAADYPSTAVEEREGTFTDHPRADPRPRRRPPRPQAVRRRRLAGTACSRSMSTLDREHRPHRPGPLDFDGQGAEDSERSVRTGTAIQASLRRSTRWSRGVVAGPSRTLPSTPKREPWHGQSHERSAELKRSRQPRWVQRSETECRRPSCAW